MTATTGIINPDLVIDEDTNPVSWDVIGAGNSGTCHIGVRIHCDRPESKLGRAQSFLGTGTIISWDALSNFSRQAQ